MPIGTLCRHEVICISEKSSIQEAAKLMKAKNVGCLIAEKDVYDDKIPFGIITDRDIAIKVAASGVDVDKITVEDAMNQDLTILKSSDSVKKAIHILKTKKIRRAPVVDQENKICGIITLDDLFILLVEELNDLKKLVQKQIVS